MSAIDEEAERAQVDLLRHALKNDGWLPVDYVEGLGLLVLMEDSLIEQGLFSFVTDPSRTPELGFALTATGLMVAAMFEGVDA